MLAQMMQVKKEALFSEILGNRSKQPRLTGPVPTPNDNASRRQIVQFAIDVKIPELWTLVSGPEALPDLQFLSSPHERPLVGRNGSPQVKWSKNAKTSGCAFASDPESVGKTGPRPSGADEP